MYNFTNTISKCLLFLGIAFLFGCADIPDELREQAEGKCGGERYTAEYQFCVDRQIYDFCEGTPYNPSNVGCCNNRQYTRETQFCSQNYIYPKCGGREYDLATKFCSDNVVYSKCGSSPYNPETQFCFGDNIYSKCGGEEYYPSSERICQNNVVVTKCGTGSYYYNPSTEFCRDDKVYDRCDGSTYNPSNQKCQSNVIVTKCGSDWYNSKTQFCRDDKVYDKCDGSTYNPSNQKCESNIVMTKCGSDWYNSKTQFCRDDKVYDLCGGQSYAPSSQRCGTGGVVETRCGTGDDWYNPFAHMHYCRNGTTLTQYDYITDARDGKKYSIIVIGTQTWMAENLNYNASGSKCYDDDTGGDSQGNCAKYGRLYNWATAMANSASSVANPSGVQGICPTGWHLPSKTEWDALMTAVGSSSAGEKLKAQSGWSSCGPSGSGNSYVCYDTYGFSALPGGRGYYGYFEDVGNDGHWWSSTETSASNAHHRYMWYNKADVGSYDDDGKTYFYSVRCVKD